MYLFLFDFILQILQLGVEPGELVDLALVLPRDVDITVLWRSGTVTSEPQLTSEMREQSLTEHTAAAGSLQQVATRKFPHKIYCK